MALPFPAVPFTQSPLSPVSRRLEASTYQPRPWDRLLRCFGLFDLPTFFEFLGRVSLLILCCSQL